MSTVPVLVIYVILGTAGNKAMAVYNAALEIGMVYVAP